MTLLNTIAKTAIATCLSTGAISIIQAAPAKALFIQNTSGLANPAQTITFNEIPVSQGTPVSNAYSSLGVTFGASLLYDTGNYSIPNVAPAQLVNFGTGNPLINIFFNTAQNQAGFTAATNGGTSTFAAYLSNTLVETVDVATDSARLDNFYGFTGITFDEIRVFAGGTGNAIVIDNLQFGTATPVPFGFTPIPGLAASGLLWSLTRLKKKLNLG
jgi:hypothetical protein